MNIQGLAKSFIQQADRTPDRVFARTTEGTEISFRQLSDAADAMIAWLADHGVRPGDTVAVMTRNSPASLALIHGLLRAGMVWVPVNPALVGDGLVHAIRLVDAAIAVCDPELEATLAACEAQPREGILVLHSRELPRTPAVRPRYEVAGPMGIAAIMFTSGTTGPAKGVLVTQTMLEIAARGVEEVGNLQDGDNLFMWEPFYHVGGAQVLVLPILRNVTLTIAEKFSASQFWQQVSTARCTHIHHLGGIPQILLKQPPSELDRSHGVRVAWGGGCPASAWRDFEDRFGITIKECYGQTEASSISCANVEGVVGAIGRPLPWFDIQVKDDTGRILGPGEGRGELVITSTIEGAIFAGYHKAPEATAKALQPDGFHTGDTGSWGEDGMLRFHGRVGDSVRCMGENVSAHEVESVANRHPQIEESAMVGVPAEIGEYDIQLFVRPTPGTKPDAEEISRWLSDKLAPYQQPRFIAFIDEFPKTPSQRIRKHLLPKSPERWERKNTRKAHTV
ncbi:class I adenylate-forming enzyme family protein [Sagittula sp. MA-2]|jgi:crotonobetaine/carnitine-CoA ligase|uniref:class I adenylate-forming enzyme family protein n=1 Tax=Sagittula sp. MA-2 TaxID=3048007 RepID=UPI0024C4276F|nr:AMP-binding protein [Sagittula sp. MA-2]WHZ38129.1 AMP-binding protein [Sagittula sp. MA-2]